MFCRSDREPEVFLVHPGGPFWAKKDEGAWTIPKGEPAEGEELLHAAQREFSEETGFDAHGPFHELGAIIQAGGKKVTVWLRGGLRSRETEEQFVRHRMAPRSKRTIHILEVDRGACSRYAASADRR